VIVWNTGNSWVVEMISDQYSLVYHPQVCLLLSMNWKGGQRDIATEIWIKNVVPNMNLMCALSLITYVNNLVAGPYAQ
jgi:hypothetical protein